MKIETKRLLIREISFNDVDDFLEYSSSPDVGPNAGWKPISDIELARRIIAGDILKKNVFSIVLKEKNKMIGTVSIYQENCLRRIKQVRQLGFSLSDKYWNNGYMTEALKGVIKYIFDNTDAKVIEVGHHSDNLRSKRVIEKLGFIYDGRICMFKKLYDGRLIDADFYSMTKDDYERIKKYE